MRSNKERLGAVRTLLMGACLIALTGFGAMQAMVNLPKANAISAQDTIAGLALAQGMRINRQTPASDQTLREIAVAIEDDQRGCGCATWRAQTAASNGFTRDMTLADAIIHRSFVAETTTQPRSAKGDTRGLLKRVHASNRTFVVRANVGLVPQPRHMNLGQASHSSDSPFAGVGAYHVAGAIGLLNQAELRPGALQAGCCIHAFRSLPNRAAAVATGEDQDDAMRLAAIWRQQANLLAECITVLLVGVGLLLAQSIWMAHRREAALAADKAAIAFANAQLEAARAVATAKAEQLEATLAGMTDGVSMVDAGMRLVEWNARFPEVAGVPAEILRVGLPMEDILHAQIMSGQFGRITDPDAEVRRRMLRLRTGPHGVVQRQRPDGHTVELRRKSLPEGGFVTLYADITEHKRTEEALREARVLAETATAAKSRFVAIVSHEIRIPLDALLNTLRLLTDSVPAPAQQALLVTARQSGDALLGLINDILEMARIEAGKLMIRPELFELRPLMTSSAAMFEVRAAERRVTVRVTVAETAPATLLTDAGRLRQVLLNLLSNAIEYSADGEIYLAAEPGRTAADGVTLIVKDSGPVIDAAVHSRLFQPFSRLEQTNSDALGGSGLGLSICQELVTLMGGSIGCEGCMGPDGRRGNAFWLSLPASAVPVPLSAGSDRLSEDPIGRPGHRLPRTRILLVEDVPANQIVTATSLRREGHMVDVVPSGEAAIKALQTTTYDLVFIDIAMPGISGEEAVATLRSLTEPARSVPTIAFTAHASPGTFRSSGMDGILSKPASVPELLDVLYAHVWSGHWRRSGSPVDLSTLTEDGSTQLEAAERRADHPVLSEDRILELRGNLPPQTFAALVEECLVDLDYRLPALRAAFAAGSISAITVHSHAMVGMAAGYGMASLETLLRTIMAAARAGDAAFLGPDALAQVEHELAAASRALRELLRDGVV